MNVEEFETKRVSVVIQVQRTSPADQGERPRCWVWGKKRRSGRRENLETSGKNAPSDADSSLPGLCHTFGHRTIRKQTVLLKAPTLVAVMDVGASVGFPCRWDAEEPTAHALPCGLPLASPNIPSCVLPLKASSPAQTSSI